MFSLRAYSAPLAIALLTSTTAVAQTAPANANPDVVAAPAEPGNGVLLYPGGNYGRIVHPLQQPGDTSADAPIQLHMPAKRVAHRKSADTVATAGDTTPDASEAANSTDSPAGTSLQLHMPAKRVAHRKAPVAVATAGDTAPAVPEAAPPAEAPTEAPSPAPVAKHKPAN